MYNLYTNYIKFLYDHIKHELIIQMSYIHHTYQWLTYINVDYSQHGGNKY